MQTRKHPIIVRISIGVEIIRIVWVKAYKRIRLGKIEKVKGHYRKY